MENNWKSWKNRGAGEGLSGIACFSRPLSQLVRDCLRSWPEGAPQACLAAAAPATSPVSVLSPAIVSQLEPVLPWLGPAAAKDSTAANSGESVRVITGTPIDSLPGFADAWRRHLAETSRGAGGEEAATVSKHVVIVERRQSWLPLISSRRPGFCVHLLLELDAGPVDVVHGLLHAALAAELATKVQLAPRSGGGDVDQLAAAAVVQAAGIAAAQAVVPLFASFESAGWLMDVPVLATDHGGRLIATTSER